MKAAAWSIAIHVALPLGAARAAPVRGARLLLIDEPFNGLDAAAMGYLRGQLTERAQAAATCIVLTSHLEPNVPVQQVLDLDAKI